MTKRKNEVTTDCADISNEAG